MSSTKSFLIVTYNIQFSLKADEIGANISKLAKGGVSIFCLQEVARQKNQAFIVDQILTKLGSNWKAVHNVGDEIGNESLGNCIIWNSAKITLKNPEKLTLIPAVRFAIHEWLLAKLIGSPTKPYLRRSIIGNFIFNDFEFKITNLHLDHIGGVKHRLRQLTDALTKRNVSNPVNYEIICGDFNNFDLLKNGKQIRNMKKIFGSEFQHISADIKWTADLYYLNTTGLSKITKFMTKSLQLHIKRRLDSIWVKGLKTLGCQKIDMLGSDHFPILAELYFEKN